MVDRLVLGRGPLVHRVVESLRSQSGTVRVVTTEENLRQSLREEGIVVEERDRTNAGALADLDAEFVVIIEETQAEALTVTRAVRDAFPDAYLLVYTGRRILDREDAVAATAELNQLADRVVDTHRDAASYVLDRIGDPGQQMQQLWTVLRGIDRLAVVTHDNPDPDAIASGVALAHLATAAGCEAQVCYYGEITHQENRAFVNVLELDLRQLDDDEGIEAFDGLALVDHSRPGVNDQLPEDSAVDIVIDHHPPRMPVDARFVDLRSGVGATSTLLVGYLDLFGVDLDSTIATALLFGIHVDTKAFTREVSVVDFEAAATIVETAELGILERIESPSVSASTIETVARAIQNRRIVGQVLVSCVGRLTERDALAQAAEHLLTLEDVNTTMVYGVMEGTIFVSARSRGFAIDIGETLRDAFDQIGSAGGHVDMAGAQITLGILEAVEDREESLQEIVEGVVEDRFLDAVTANMTDQSADIYAGFDDNQYLIQEAEETHGADDLRERLTEEELGEETEPDDETDTTEE